MPQPVLKFAPNLSMLYPELDFLDRFDAAALDGFRAVEFAFPYEFPIHELRARADETGLEVVLFNSPPGDLSKGERGLACVPGREADHRNNFLRGLEYAHALGCRQLHVQSGIVAAGVTREAARDLYLSNLAWSAAEAKSANCTLLIEPLNERDRPGYLVAHQADAHDMVATLALPNVKVLMDLYHCQVVEGDIAARLRQLLPTGNVGHLQIGSVPERNEPDAGELAYPYLLAVIEEHVAAGLWDGWIGCEYRPLRGMEPGGTTKGFAWMRAMGYSN